MHTSDCTERVLTYTPVNCGMCTISPLPQVWRGEHFACSRAEVQQIKKQLQTDPLTVPGSSETKYWKDLTGEEQTKALKDRLKKYCQKVGEGGGW